MARKLPEKAVRNQVAFGCDWLPTLAELCGVKAPETVLDGKSLTAVIRDDWQPSPHQVLHWETGTARNPIWAVREGPWGLLGKPLDNTAEKLEAKDKESFLANLDNDPSEVTNVADQFPHVAERLRKAHEAWVGQISGSAGR